MPDVRARIRVPSSSGQAVTATIDRDDRGVVTTIFPCKEFSIVDDMLNVADAASVSIANPDGERSGKFFPGQRIEIDLADADVAGGDWIRSFTGRVTGVDYASDVSGGSVIQISAMDLGWHLTSCDAKPLVSTAGGTIAQLIRKLVDPSWGFAASTASGPDITTNDLNRKIKQGRTGVERQFQQERSRGVLPYIQVEPGQKPMDVLGPYLKREGLLLNVSAKGGIVLFRPDYRQASPYAAVEYHGASEGTRSRNSVIGRPGLFLTIEGLYSRAECWSTVVNPLDTEHEISNNPNAIYTKAQVSAVPNPLPFDRLAVIMEGDAINSDLRLARAQWKLQMEAFNSWRYEAEVVGHSSQGAFYVSDSMLSVHDTVHGVEGTYYVQSVRRSYSEAGGARTKMTLRRPLLNPALTALGGGAGR